MPAIAQLFGRMGESGILEQLLDTVRGGQSAVLVVRGEPGIGKTALLQYLIGHASGLRVVRAVGVESEMELAFAGLHEVCASMLGRLDTLAEPRRRALTTAFGLAPGDNPDRFLVALAALSLLAETSEEQPLLCVVDDAQWLDQASAQILGFVGRRLLAEPIGLVFAARTPTASPDHLAGLPDHLAGLPELLLGGLDEEACRAVLSLVTSGPLDESVRDRIIEETQGNPLALLELHRGRGVAELAGGFALPDAVGLPQRIERQYVDRLRELPDEVQRLVLLAAADSLGDATLFFRAARLLGLDTTSVALAAHAGLMDVGAKVRFRHPLLRSAAYRASSPDDRRTIHGVLAAATDPELDPDRRAWHRAHATSRPDAAVASELLSSADRARRRGGMAAAAAFWERAVALTPDAGERATRALAAAEVKYAAGDFEAARVLLVKAEIGPLDELGRASVQRMRAQIAFALKRGREAPTLLLRAAQRLQTLDAGLARQAYLEALLAAIYAGRLADGEDVREIARAAKLAPFGPEPVEHSQLLLRGLAERLTGGYAAAAPTLRQALRRYRSQPHELDWLCVAYNLVAMDLWDDEAWFELAADQVDLARANGALSWLPFALDHLAENRIQAGELSRAAALLVEGERVDAGIRAAPLPYVSLLLAAWRGDAPAAAPLLEVMVRGASARGEGSALTFVEYAKAVLYNGLGEYALAAEAAHSGSEVDELVISPWALYELVEAAARSDQTRRASAAAERLASMAGASASHWARGAAARSRALVSEGRAAEDLHREAIELLGTTRMATQLARARLSYGEWLRRENRRIGARDHVRAAFEALTSMGARAFAERARRELRATGEKVARRSESALAELTPQEEEIAQLARRGRTNPEIGTQLFISARTVEWHLRKAFAKLQITSRRELDVALTRRLTPPDASLNGLAVAPD